MIYRSRQDVTASIEFHLTDVFDKFGASCLLLLLKLLKVVLNLVAVIRPEFIPQELNKRVRKELHSEFAIVINKYLEEYGPNLFLT